MYVSLVLPAYNEERNLRRVVSESMTQLKINGLRHHIYIVDDGSTDHTAAVIRDLEKLNSHITGVYLQNNQGFGGAVREGIMAAKAAGISWQESDPVIVIMDADGQLKIEDWLRLKPWAEPTIALWWGIRENRAEGRGRRSVSRLYNTLCRHVFGIPEALDVECGLKAIRAAYIPEHLPTVRGATINPVLYSAALKNGAIVRQFPVHHFLRQYGHPTGLSYKVIVRSLFELVSYAIGKNELSGSKEFSNVY